MWARHVRHPLSPFGCLRVWYSPAVGAVVPDGLSRASSVAAKLRRVPEIVVSLPSPAAHFCSVPDARSAAASRLHNQHTAMSREHVGGVGVAYVATVRPRSRRFRTRSSMTCCASALSQPPHAAGHAVGSGYWSKAGERHIVRVGAPQQYERGRDPCSTRIPSEGGFCPCRCIGLARSPSAPKGAARTQHDTGTATGPGHNYAAGDLTQHDNHVIWYLLGQVHPR